MKEKEESFERFLPTLDQVKTTIMRMVYSDQQSQLVNLIEAIQEIVSSRLLQKPSLSFCLT